MKRLQENCQIKLMAFDLDGTLLDSVPDLTKAIQLTLAELNLPNQQLDSVRGWVGNGARVLVKRALSGNMKAEVPSDLFERAYPIFLKHYAEHLNENSVLYNGVEQTLQALKDADILLACITNKPEQFTLPLLKELGLLELFDRVVCGDTFQHRKPHPMPLLETAKFFNVSPAQAIMVGDSVNDIAAAQAAGFYSICVDYGYHGEDDVSELGADVVISHFSEINQLLQQAA
ncbi:MAG: phosphoglycolate phosphatase [Cycloclasticus sp.]|nr:MAG: phosphoglycolate phosphatase [Cycloclasticus sp. Phe_18]MDF1689291.1 phosphoglycolate phosphatase [Cycloclasticus sp.]MEE4292186.1 phosphoglycolate phosphatase [Cycloclasticus sp.]